MVQLFNDGQSDDSIVPALDVRLPFGFHSAG